MADALFLCIVDKLEFMIFHCCCLTIATVSFLFLYCLMLPYSKIPFFCQFLIFENKHQHSLVFTEKVWLCFNVLCALMSSHGTGNSQTHTHFHTADDPEDVLQY